MSASPTRVGFFGKMPARGDFVRSHLSRRFADAVSAWMDAALPDLPALLGPDWPARWTHARPWRFVVSPGTFGPTGASGLWLASSDGVGRAFPLVVAVEGAALDDAALTAAQAIAMDAATGRVGPDKLAGALATIRPTARPDRPVAAETALWWRESGELLTSEAPALGPALTKMLAP